MSVKKTRTRVRQKSINTGEVITKQDLAETTNINKIMAKYQKTGHIPQVTAQPLYGDVASGIDYSQAMNVVAKAQQQFMSMPAQVRDKFNNDPVEFLNFMNNPENKEEIITLGLGKREEVAPETIVTMDDVNQTETVAAETTATEPAQ